MAWTLLNTAAVYAEKDPPLWLAVAERALARTPDLTARWIGGVDPAYRALVDDAVARAGGRLDFPGPMAHDAVLAEVAAPGVILLIASTIEVFPLSIMEASRAGAPIVCRRFAGYQEVLGADYPLAFSGADEAADRIAAVIANAGQARVDARALFDHRFAKDDAWYARVEAALGPLMGRVA